MKIKQVRVYSFGRSCIKDGTITSENLEDNIVTLSESFLTLAYECYKNIKLEDGQLIEEIIKVLLPDTEEDAKEEWDNGLELNGKKYFAWFATPGGMKQESIRGKCETFFIQEDLLVFATEFEDLISLGKFNEIENSQAEICINKDVLSRLALGVSSCQMAGEMPDIIVLPQPTFHIIKDYKTIEKFTEQVEDKKGKMVDQVNYRLVDYHFDDDIDVFDGGGIATPRVFNQIQKELELKYPVEFAIIRGYGIGIKGMITKFNIIKYLDVFYKEDTEYCKKVDKKFYLRDMWNEWREVTDNMMLLNESMVKLAKYYKPENKENMDIYLTRLAGVNAKYMDIIGKLYITKVNKSDDDIDDYRRLNYQLLTALALSKKDYMALLKEDVRTYRKILKPFTKASDKDEWLINIDAIRLFFKNIIISDHQDNEEAQLEAQKIAANVVTKCEELLNISEEFISLKYVKNNLAKLIEKKCRELACGKVTAKAKYQYIAIDPISYMNFAMFRDQGKNGLDAGQFYSADCKDGEIRTIARNPLVAYSEVHNVKFVRNAFLDNYLSHCRELIYFNQKSDILALMSSADTDGDACTVIDSNIIRNAVVTPKDGKYFINKDDGHKELMAYNAENRFFATYRASGNLIGKIALKSARINSNSQRTYDYYDKANAKFVLNMGLDEEEKKQIKEKIDNGEWITTYHASEQHREDIKQRFYENELDIYIVLYNAMVAIDAPKTLYFPSPEDMEVINKKYGRKARFLKYKENKADVIASQYEYTFGLLDSVSRNIQNTLLDEIENTTTRFDNRANLIQGKLLNGDYSVADYPSCLEEIEKLYKDYTEERQAANNECYKEIKKETKHRDWSIENESWSQWEEDEYDATVAALNKAKYKQYKEIDAKYMAVADEILKNYDIATIANAIGNLKNCTEDFIINLFFPVFGYLNTKLQNNRYVYVEDDDGEISYLYEKYRKIKIEAIDNRDIVRNLHLEEKHRLNVIDIKADIRARVLVDEVIGLIESELTANGQIVFDIRVSENKVILTRDDKDMLEVFSEFIQIKEYSLLNSFQIKFELLANIAPSRKSLKLTATEIS